MAFIADTFHLTKKDDPDQIQPVRSFQVSNGVFQTPLWPTIYLGQTYIQVLDSLPYFQPILCRWTVKIVNSKGVEFVEYPGVFDCPKEFPGVDWPIYMSPGEEVILSTYRRYSLGFHIYTILSINFNCSRKSMLVYWHPDQMNKMGYDSNGIPIP